MGLGEYRERGTFLIVSRGSGNRYQGLLQLEPVPAGCRHRLQFLRISAGRPLCKIVGVQIEGGRGWWEEAGGWFLF